MKNKDINNSNIEVINLDKIIDQALEHNADDNIALKQILEMNEKNIITTDEALGMQESNLLSTFVKIDNNEFSGIKSNDESNNEIYIQSKGSNDVIENENDYKQYQQENIIFLKNKNDDETSENDNKNIKLNKKKNFAHIRILILFVGSFTVLLFLILATFSSEILAFFDGLVKKLTFDTNTSTSEKIVTVISKSLIFIIKLIALFLAYFIINKLISLLFNLLKKQQIKKQLLNIKKSKKSLRLRLNVFKSNIKDIELKYNTSYKGISLFLKLIFVIFIFVIILSAFNIDLRTLFASAGVITLVITLAAQTILIDFFSGFLFLFEDHYNVGELVTINGVTGRIISANIKKICIQTSTTGEQHFILHSQIKHVINYSKQSGKAFLKVEVSYETDLQKCIEILQTELDKCYHENKILSGGPENISVNAFNSSGIELRIIMPTKKEKQWEAERWLRLKIHQIFIKHNIEIPYQKMIIYKK